MTSAAPAQESKPGQPALTSAVRDDANLFDTRAVEKARDELRDLETRTGLGVFIQTVSSLPGNDPILEFANRRVREWGGTGAYVLIDKATRKFELVLTGPAREAVEASRRVAVRDAFLKGFRGGHFDAGLKAGVDAIAAALMSAKLLGKLPAPGLGGASLPPLVQRNQVRLTLEGARLVIEGAEAKAAEMSLKMNIAVVDDGGHLIAFARMNGARPASGYTAITKATSAATFRQESGPLPKGTTAPEPLLNLSLQNAASASGGKITTLFGGVPILVDNQVNRPPSASGGGSGLSGGRRGRKGGDREVPGGARRDTETGRAGRVETRDRQAGRAEKRRTEGSGRRRVSLGRGRRETAIGDPSRPGQPAERTEDAGRGHQEDDRAEGVHGGIRRGGTRPGEPRRDDLRRARAGLGDGEAPNTRGRSAGRGRDQVKVPRTPRRRQGGQSSPPSPTG